MNVMDVRIVFENYPQFANVIFESACDSVRTNFRIDNQPVFSAGNTGDVSSSENQVVTSEVRVPLKGFLFMLDKIMLLSESCRCLILASENKYFSAWIQLPSQYGSVAAISPAFIID